jgi:hypothetical protein
MKGLTLAAGAITIIMCGAIGVFVYDSKKEGNRFQQRREWKAKVAKCGDCDGLMINDKCVRPPILPPVEQGITVEADCGDPIACYIDPNWQPAAKRTVIASNNYRNGKFSFLNTLRKGVVKFGKLGYGGRVLAEKFEARRAQAVGIVSVPDCYCLDEGKLRDDEILPGCKINGTDATALKFLQAVVVAIGNDESDLTCENICGVDTATCEKYCDLADRRRNLKAGFDRSLAGKGSGCGAGCGA